MKKIIAVWLSINLLVLNAMPSVAQLLPTAAKGAGKITAADAAGLLGKLDLGAVNGILPAGASLLDPALQRAAITNTSLPLTWQSSQLNSLPDAAAVDAHKMLSHPNVQERNVLLRTNFVSLALRNKVLPADKAEASDVYRQSLKNNSNDLPLMLSDIASLGVLGSAEKDAAVILQVAKKSLGTAHEAAVTASAARALLRLGAYEELAQLAQKSTVQPELWDGIEMYAKLNRLPLTLPQATRTSVSVREIQKELTKWGPLNYLVVDPSLRATVLYVNTGKVPLTTQEVLKAVSQPKPLATRAEKVDESDEAAAELGEVSAPVVAAPAAEKFVVAPTQTAALMVAQEAALSKADLLAQTKSWIERLKPKGLNSADETKFSQRAALYLTAFSIGLEIGTPIMASIKTALNLPLSLAVLVTVATYSPYLFGSFIANWLKGKVGRKGTVNTGLALMGGSFALGATALGLDGSFTAWDNQIGQFLGILGALTVASTGSVFIHGSVGPVMTEISHKANELVRQKRGTYVELSRSIGMMASFAFPFIATSMLGMDWSAPFLLALPVVGASALTLNWAKLPNTKPTHQKLTGELKTVQSPVMDGARKPRKAMAWKESFLNNSYVRLLREEPGVGSFISALFIMNAVEMGINSGFLFMVPQLTDNESLKYLLGMSQFAVPFLAGRYLAGHFLKWFPKRNLSIATTLGGVSALAALGLTDHLYAFTSALAMSELGISTAFTLAFARTAVKPSTQDRITSLIMATAVACAVGPMMLTWVAEGLMGAGIPEAGATLAALIGIPSGLAALSAGLFRRMENKTIPGLSKAKESLANLMNLFKRKQK